MEVKKPPFFFFSLKEKIQKLHLSEIAETESEVYTVLRAQRSVLHEEHCDGIINSC